MKSNDSAEREAWLVQNNEYSTHIVRVTVVRETEKTYILKQNDGITESKTIFGNWYWVGKSINKRERLFFSIEEAVKCAQELLAKREERARYTIEKTNQQNAELITLLRDRKQGSIA